MAQNSQTDSVTFSMRAAVVALAFVLVLLQWRLWFSDDGWAGMRQLRADVAAQISENERLAERNARLQAEVSDLKSGFVALEEIARSDLGMVGADESFYLFVPEADGAEETR